MLFLDRPDAPNIIAPLNIYDPSTAPGAKVTYDDVLAFVESRLAVSETFRERLVRVPFDVDRPYWIRDPAFDLEYHIREIALPRPGTWRQLCTQVARIAARPLDLTRPPWELYFIDGVDGIDGVPTGSFATLIKLHHAAVDGVAGAELLSALHDQHPEQADLPASDGWEPEQPPSAAALLRRATVHAFTRPAGIVRSVGPLAGALRSRPKNAPSARSLVSATRFNGPVSPHRTFGGMAVPLSELKALRAPVPGSTVNDVALTIIGGAMKDYLVANGEAPEESLVALVPVSMRPTLAQSGVTKVEAAAGGNSFAMVAVSMATDVEDPVERLRVIQSSTEWAKDTAVSARALTDVSEALPGALLATAQRSVMRFLNQRGQALATHTTVTNVPGSQHPLYFCGAKALMMTGMPPAVNGQGLVQGLGSYDGTVTFFFTADRQMMPDPEVYEGCLAASLRALGGAVGV
jgi:WS/DGAT/MGAT family acyltransferase